MFNHLLKVWRKKDLATDTIDVAVDTMRRAFDMYKEVVNTLRNEENTHPGFDVSLEDKKINKSERDIRKKVLTHLLLTDKTEINEGLVLATIVNDIERIGDYTKNIDDLAELHEGKLNFGNYDNIVVDIEQKIDTMFVNTIQAFADSNKDLARKVMETYKQEISGRCDNTQKELIQTQKKINKDNAIILALYLRYLKRVAAHLYNIATSVVNPFHRIGYKEKQKQ